MTMMTTRFLGVTLALILGAAVAYASTYDEPIELFKHAGASAVFFDNCYSYRKAPGAKLGCKRPVLMPTAGLAYERKAQRQSAAPPDTYNLELAVLVAIQ